MGISRYTAPMRMIATGAAIALSLLIGCGASAPQARSADPSLASYTGHLAELFDDRIEPGALGSQLGVLDDNAGPTARGDNLLRERTQMSDAVAHARVTTVTSQAEERGRSWQVGFSSVERLAGSRPLDPEFVLHVASNSPAAGILQASEGRLIGKTLIAFVHAFRNPTGEDTELHFHIARDGKAELDAVRASVLLDQIR
jgi:hypothetical protein